MSNVAVKQQLASRYLCRMCLFVTSQFSRIRAQTSFYRVFEILLYAMNFVKALILLMSYWFLILNIVILLEELSEGRNVFPYCCVILPSFTHFKIFKCCFYELVVNIHQQSKSSLKFTISTLQRMITAENQLYLIPN